MWDEIGGLPVRRTGALGFQSQVLQAEVCDDVKQQHGGLPFDCMLTVRQFPYNTFTIRGGSKVMALSLPTKCNEPRSLDMLLKKVIVIEARCSPTRRAGKKHTCHRTQETMCANESITIANYL